MFITYFRQTEKIYLQQEYLSGDIKVVADLVAKFVNGKTVVIDVTVVNPAAPTYRRNAANKLTTLLDVERKGKDSTISKSQNYATSQSLP